MEHGRQLMKYRSYSTGHPDPQLPDTGVDGDRDNRLSAGSGFAILYTANIVKAYKSMDDDMKKQGHGSSSHNGNTVSHLVDFDLSLGAVSIILWASFALQVHFKGEDRGWIKALPW